MSQASNLAEDEGENSESLTQTSEEEDEDDDDDESSNKQSDIPVKKRRKVVSEPKDWTVDVLKQYYDRGIILAQPKYQREYVWENKPTLKSRLIESLLLNIPIPPLYLGKLDNGKYEVIDGQQRLTTILNFVGKKTTFPLEKLTTLKQLKGCTFQELDEADQLLITASSTMRTIVIDIGGDDGDLRYEIFERLNRGSVALNEQEIRNCIYRSAFNELLSELITKECWRKIIGTEEPLPRFKEQEHVLRFLALAKGLDSYRSSLKSFMNIFMNSQSNLKKGSEVLEQYKTLFQQTMQNVYDVFGEESGRLYGPPKTQRRLNEGVWDKDFSILALEIQAFALVGHARTDVQAIKDQIREAYIFYLLTDQYIRTAIENRTSRKQHVKLRCTGFKAEVNNLLLSARDNPRFFSREFRQRLFDADPNCKLCPSQIHSFDDSTVDHVIPWAKGGKTVPENGQLAHRFCNAQKNASGSVVNVTQNLASS